MGTNLLKLAAYWTILNFTLSKNNKSALIVTLFVGHCGAFCGLKWRIWRAKIYFNPMVQLHRQIC